MMGILRRAFDNKRTAYIVMPIVAVYSMGFFVTLLYTALLDGFIVLFLEFLLAFFAGLVDALTWPIYWLKKVPL